MKSRKLYKKPYSKTKKTKKNQIGKGKFSQEDKTIIKEYIREKLLKKQELYEKFKTRFTQNLITDDALLKIDLFLSMQK